MKAAVTQEIGGSEVIRFVDVPDPEPGPGEVRIRVRATSLNHLDIWVRRGLPGGPTFPHIGGADAAGEVDAVGAGVDRALVGTRVSVNPALGYGWYDAAGDRGVPPLRMIGEHVNGGLAELCVVPVENAVPLPDGVPFETAAATGVAGVSAWHALFGRGGLRAGETVLITGASGGVATLAIQMAKMASARVLAVTSGADNVRRVGELGADKVYDRLDPDFARAVWADTGKRGADLVLDSVGAAMWAFNVKSLAVRGRLVTYGASGGPLAETDLRPVFWKELSIVGATMGTPAEFRTVVRLVAEGRVRPVIHEVLPLAEARRAHEELERGDVFGKLVLLP
jgi:NADPH:quinone reductase-like Zn-dependent oxidoreductase